jgi:nitroreductase
MPDSPLMNLNLSADEVLTTTRAVRKRLDLERPVEREVLLECVQMAVQAPTGSNSQGWQWMFVEDPDKKKVIADYYGSNFDQYVGMNPVEYADDDPRSAQRPRVTESAIYLRQHFHEVPVLLIPLLEGRPTGSRGGTMAGFWGSILPAVWSFMLAARNRGLGTAWTTLHLSYEKEVAELLGIPPDRYSQAGLFPVAYTKGTDFKVAERLPVDGLVHFDSW